ncbi:MAG TPA: hypothetical protein VJ738_21520 [Steroidobacteraceae bacterium]|nr:hypothetical protein [Steroidobacteraceae bacterium]
MTALPQTRASISPVEDGSSTRSRAADIVPAAAEASGARSRARQTLPALDPSTVFGCVDWFLYPEAEPRAAAQA